MVSSHGVSRFIRRRRSWLSSSCSLDWTSTVFWLHVFISFLYALSSSSFTLSYFHFQELGRRVSISSKAYTQAFDEFVYFFIFHSFAFYSSVFGLYPKSFCNSLYIFFRFFIVLYLLPEVTLLFFPLFLLFSSEVIYAVNIHSSPFSIFLKRFDMVHLFFHLALKSSD